MVIENVFFKLPNSCVLLNYATSNVDYIKIKSNLLCYGTLLKCNYYN